MPLTSALSAEGAALSSRGRKAVVKGRSKNLRPEGPALSLGIKGNAASPALRTHWFAIHGGYLMPRLRHFKESLPDLQLASPDIHRL